MAELNSPFSYFPVILVSVSLSAGAQAVLKAGMSSAAVQRGMESGNVAQIATVVFANPFVLAGLGLYFGSALVWLVVLSKVPLSYAYPFVAMGIAMTAVLGWFLFDEGFGLMKLAGTALIMLGIVLLAKS